MMNEAATLLKESAVNWKAHRAPKMGAALAYYTVLSLAPLVMMVLSVVSLVFGHEAARRELTEQFSQMIGQSGADVLNSILLNASSKSAGIIGTIVSFVVLLFGASGVFGELQDSLNQIWEVKPKEHGGFWETVRDRFLSFAMVFVIGFLLIVSLIVSAAIAAGSKYLSDLMPGMEMLWQSANFIVSFCVITVLFGIIFRVLPDVAIQWREVLIGAVITSLLFSIGKLLLGLYLGKSAVGSAYGAAGSFIVLLVWVYYSAQILFFGAEFTRVYALHHGKAQGKTQPHGKTEPGREHLSGGSESHAYA